MNTAPIAKWEGAQAYFTFADEPLALGIALGLAVLSVVSAIIIGSLHESECYVKVEKNGG